LALGFVFHIFSPTGKASSTLLIGVVLFNTFCVFGANFVLSVACFSGVFFTTGSLGAVLVDCTKGVFTTHLLLLVLLILEIVLVFALSKEDKGCLTFALPNSCTHNFAKGAGTIGAFTCGSPQGATAVAFGAGSALAFKKLSRSFADFILLIFAMSTNCSPIV
jgi:hypothetical protein